MELRYQWMTGSKTCPLGSPHRGVSRFYKTLSLQVCEKGVSAHRLFGGVPGGAHGSKREERQSQWMSAVSVPDLLASHLISYSDFKR
ncbi:hypothetical protein KEM54_005572 [Ascosphaera aggregata]|nr:hypothetical protein KEM54_005572 [Ascosphaera aggregata]